MDFDVINNLKKHTGKPMKEVQASVKAEIEKGALNDLPADKKTKEQIAIYKALAGDEFVTRAFDKNGNGVLEDKDLDEVEKLDKEKGISKEDTAKAVFGYGQDLLKVAKFISELVKAKRLLPDKDMDSKTMEEELKKDPGIQTNSFEFASNVLTKYRRKDNMDVPGLFAFIKKELEGGMSFTKTAAEKYFPE